MTALIIYAAIGCLMVALDARLKLRAANRKAADSEKWTALLNSIAEQRFDRVLELHEIYETTATQLNQAQDELHRLKTERFLIMNAKPEQMQVVHLVATYPTFPGGDGPHEWEVRV